jgi:hypothetical protein
MFRAKNNQAIHQKLKIRYDRLLFLILTFLFLLPFSYLSLALAQEKMIYNDEGKRDPFIALVTPDGRLLNLDSSGGKAKIVLEGIVYDKDGRSYAIINDEVVSIGDYILGHAVFKIEEDKVILLKDNQPIEYKLEKEE